MRFVHLPKWLWPTSAASLLAHYSLSAPAQSSADTHIKDADLKVVLIVFRHGARSPLTSKYWEGVTWSKGRLQIKCAIFHLPNHHTSLSVLQRLTDAIGLLVALCSCILPHQNKCLLVPGIDCGSQFEAVKLSLSDIRGGTAPANPWDDKQVHFSTCCCCCCRPSLPDMHMDCAAYLRQQQS